MVKKVCGQYGLLYNGPGFITKSNSVHNHERLDCHFFVTFKSFDVCFRQKVKKKTSNDLNCYEEVTI